VLANVAVVEADDGQLPRHLDPHLQAPPHGARSSPSGP
jgi:hypothetical protein